MKRLVIILIAISFAILAGCQSTNDQGSDNDSESSEIVKSSKEFITLLEEGQYEEATNYFNESMKEERSPDSLKEEWDSLIEQLGEFNNQKYSTTTELNGYEVVLINGYFEETVVQFNFSYNNQGKISGYYVQ